MATNQPANHRSSALPKSPTGIQGLDEITGGGLPAGRPTLICGSAGCGKTMLAMEFLVRGATQFGEPGVFMMFEENAAELTANVRSLGFDLDGSRRRKRSYSITSISSAARSRRRASMILKGCSSGSAMPSIHRCEARGARHGGGAVRRAAQSRHPARGIAAAVPLAEGSRHDGGHHRRERRGHRSRATGWRNTWPIA